MINYELLLTLSWFKNYVITTRAYKDKFVGTGTNENPRFPEVNSLSKCTFQLTDTKLNVSVVTLSAEDDNKLLEQLKTKCKITIKWNKYRSEMNKHSKTNNWNYLIDATFNKVNRLFVNRSIKHLFQSTVHQ